MLKNKNKHTHTKPVSELKSGLGVLHDISSSQLIQEDQAGLLWQGIEKLGFPYGVSWDEKTLS